MPLKYFYSGRPNTVVLLLLLLPLGVNILRVESKKVKIKAGVTIGPERHRGQRRRAVKQS